MDFRHDVPETDFAWGLEFRDTERAPFYRVEEVLFDHAPSTFGAVFVEHKDVLGATVRLRVGNVFNANTTLLRTVWSVLDRSPPNLIKEVGLPFNSIVILLCIEILSLFNFSFIKISSDPRLILVVLS